MSTVKLIRRDEKSRALRARIEALKPYLPKSWVLLFLHDHPEWNRSEGIRTFLSQVMAGRSLHEETITELENWAAEKFGFAGKGDPSK